MSYRFGLKSRPFMKEDEAGCIEAAAWIFLKSHTKDRDGTILLTPECRGISELTAWVNGLKKELDSLAVSARKRFDKEKARRKRLLQAN